MSVNPSRQSTAVLLKNTAAAPFVYFDNAPVFGGFAGHVEVELAARILMPTPGTDGRAGVNSDMACTAHLRCSPAAAMHLISALTEALKMLPKLQSEAPETESTK
jgi:hypothetical protein